MKPASLPRQSSTTVTPYRYNPPRSWNQEEPAAWPRDRIASNVVIADRTAVWGLASVYLLFAYEWLISGLDKIFDAGFKSGLADELRDATTNNPDRWYAHFMTSFAIPHAQLLATVVEWGEVVVALGLIAGAARLLLADRLSTVWQRRCDLALVVGLFGSALMTANYYFMSGGRFPWINTGGAFDEGIDIDGLLALVSTALLIVTVAAMLRSRHHHAEITE